MNPLDALVALMVTLAMLAGLALFVYLLAGLSEYGDKA